VKFIRASGRQVIFQARTLLATLIFSGMAVNAAHVQDGRIYKSLLQ